MNSGFFATAEGVKVIEFNARFGDPECMNIMSLFSGSWPDVMQAICDRRLTGDDVPLRAEASVVLYLVSPDYALRGGAAREFELDEPAIERTGCEVFFSSAERIGTHRFRTVGTSRAVALAATSPQLQDARSLVAGAAASVPVLEWRRDVGDPRYLQGLQQLLGAADALAG